MKLNTLFITAALAVTKLYAQKCGEGIGKCSDGKCCSKYGWCGTSDDYCGKDCQQAFGNCNSISVQTHPISTDGRCGASNGNTSCPSGQCCSKYGWCGTKDDYCGSNCLPEYGQCGNVSSSTTKSSTKTTTTTTTTTIAITTNINSTYPISTDGKCGPNNGNTVCANNKCCSKYGWCGTTDDYCGTGCQSEFGRCGDATSFTTTTTTTTTVESKPTDATHPISTDGKCGPKNGNTVCANNKCCSKYGWCGTSDDYCGTGCQSEFGRCGDATSTTTTTIKTTTTTTNSATSKPTLPISTDGRCGPEFGTACPYGRCCSKYGWCSASDSHCNEGCQHNYGDCAEDIAKRIKVFTKCVNDKHWALTFDDGPYIYDEALLDFLKSKNVKATFFVNGNTFMNIYSEQARKIITRMYAEGHEIENHTFNHVNLTIHTPEEITKEITQIEIALEDIIGVKPAFIRPPYGRGAYDQHVQETIQSLGYNGIIMWNVDTMDWDNKGNTTYALEKFEKTLGEPIISLNHNHYELMSEEKLINSAKVEIEYMIEKGYTPVTMSECTGLDPYQK